MKKIYLMLAFMLVSVAMSATTYKGQVYKGEGTKPYLSTLPYDATAGTYDVNIKVSDDKSSITILNWTGTTGDDVTLGFGEDGAVNIVNGKTLPDPDNYKSTWVSTGGLYEQGYYGIYVYGGGTFKSTGLPYSKVTLNEDGSGEGYFEVYSYDDGDYRNVFFKWGTETVAEITEKTYPLLVKKYDGSFSALPFNENGEYLTTVSVASDLSYIVINDWDKGSGESMKIYPNTENSTISIINGSTEGVYINLGIKDGDFNYTYAYAGGYGSVEFAAEDGSEGEGCIWLYQYSADASAPYYFSWPGELSGIKTVNADTTSANAPAYNLAGQRVNANANGIVVRGGKKFINK